MAISNKNTNKTYQWAIVGAGPAGLASLGLLLDQGINSSEIIWIDPNFKVGDFGQKWGEVSSNTSVKLFLKFLTDIQSFDYQNRPSQFKLDTLNENGFSQLKEVAKPLQWVTDHLRDKINTVCTKVTHQFVENGTWHLETNQGVFKAEKVILATGSNAKSLQMQNNIEEIDLSISLTPSRLKEKISNKDTIAVFGSSHSAMIIIKNLLDQGAKKVINFYLSPLRYALNMGDWILYDNTGLKGETAKWTRENISKQLHPQVKRYLSTKEQISQHLGQCNKAVYAIGFDQRTPKVDNINLKEYDTSSGIIAPGLFGAGIAFPRQVTDPNGNKELNVGLFKFMNDINQVLPIWMNYGL